MSDSKNIGAVIDRAIILRYQEDASQLVASLDNEGIKSELQNVNYTDEEMQYSRQSRTFLNHRLAWQKASEQDGYTLICESDFVPCRGMGRFPVFWPTHNELAWGYLYQGSPRLLAILGKEAWLRGHTAPLVAYVINSQVAKILLQFFDSECETYDLRSYFTFDSHLQWYAMGRGAEAYIPARHYGEHGGEPNKEHAFLGGLAAGGEHHADALMGPLAFMPAYAHGSRWKFWKVRMTWSLLGFARLFMGRWICRTNVYQLSGHDIMQMYWVGVKRLNPFNRVIVRG